MSATGYHNPLRLPIGVFRAERIPSQTKFVFTMSTNVDLPPPARGGARSSFLPGIRPAPSLLTNALAAAGRALLALVVRVDIGKMARIETHIADAGQIMQWLTTAVVNVELLVTWLVVWPSLHIGMLLVSRFVFGQSHGSPQILIAVEVIPALMLAFAIVRVPVAALPGR